MMAENGKDLLGKDMLVEFAKGKPDRGGGGYRGDRDRGYRGDRDGYRGGGRSQDCFECGRPGHFARDCPDAIAATVATEGGTTRDARDVAPEATVHVRDPDRHRMAAAEWRLLSTS